MKTKTYNFRASAREAKAIDVYCQKEGVNASDAIRQLIAEKLAYYIIDEEERKDGNNRSNLDFSNVQKFKIGDKLEFYCKPESGDKFAGVHTVKKTFIHPDGSMGVQTDITQKVAVPKDLFIHVHWFKPWDGKPSKH